MKYMKQKQSQKVILKRTQNIAYLIRQSIHIILLILILFCEEFYKAAMFAR